MSTGDFPESLSQVMLAGCNVSREIGRTYSSVHVLVGACLVVSNLTLPVCGLSQTL